MSGIGASMRIASIVFPGTPTNGVLGGHKTFDCSGYFRRILLDITVAQVVLFYEICYVCLYIALVTSEQFVLAHHWSSVHAWRRVAQCILSRTWARKEECVSAGDVNLLGT